MQRWFLFAVAVGLCGCKSAKAPWQRLTVSAAPAAPATPPEPPRTAPIEVRIVDGMGLTIRAHTQNDEGVELVVANAGREPINVSSELVLEAKTIGEWRAVEPRTVVAIRRDCATPPSECVSLAPGAEWFPPRWPAVAGTSACAASPEGTAAVGELRFVAKSCDGATRYVGDAFRR